MWLHIDSYQREYTRGRVVLGGVRGARKETLKWIIFIVPRRVCVCVLGVGGGGGGGEGGDTEVDYVAAHTDAKYDGVCVQ